MVGQLAERQETESQKRNEKGRFTLEKPKREEPTEDDPLGEWAPPARSELDERIAVGWWPSSMESEPSGEDPRLRVLWKRGKTRSENSLAQQKSAIAVYERWRIACLRAQEKGFLESNRPIPPFWPTVQSATACLFGPCQVSI